MTKYAIELNQTPNQSFSFDAGNNVIDMHLRTTTEGVLYADVSVDGVPVFFGRTCCHKMPLFLTQRIRGNLYFEDRYGNDDPDYRDFNDRFMLIYDDGYVL